ncbi:MAG: sigma-70 family RNA polymerase sigma factor [Nitratireductor sp.]|nr:sigma-70 family RNA polymerase sigma factor [Nitratireductor sp.]
MLANTGLKSRAAFDQLYLATAPKLFGVLIRILKDPIRAEDALQDVFVKIWQKAGSYRAGEQPAMGWLITVARHHAIDVIRADRRVHDDLDDHHGLAAGGPDPEQAAIAAGERGRLQHCLEELDPQKAEAVVAAYVEGYSYQELAERFGIPLNTMRTWLRRSLASLRKCLDDG